MEITAKVTKTPRNIAVCLTKKRGHAACVAFAEGIEKTGDHARIFEPSMRWIPTIDERYDVIVSACEFHDSKLHKRKNGQKKEYVLFRSKLTTLGKDTLIIESAAFKDRKTDPVNDDKFYSVGIKGIKSEGEYNNINSPPDRWDKIGYGIKPWRKDGDYVLYIMQNFGGIGLKNLDYHPNNPLAYFHDYINWLDKFTNRQVRVRLHPNQVYAARAEGLGKVKERKRKRHLSMFASYPSITVTGEHFSTLEEDISGAWCAIGNTSNALCECVINGVPIITTDKFSMAYDMAEHDIENLENPRTPDRTQWCHDLAYTQWTIEEMRNGDPWIHLKEKLRS